MAISTAPLRFETLYGRYFGTATSAPSIDRVWGADKRNGIDKMKKIFRTAVFLLLAAAPRSASATDFVPIAIQGDASSIQSVYTDIKCPGE